MAGIREIQKANATMLLRRIEKCETEEDVEKVSDLAEEMVQAQMITKKVYRFIEEELDDQIAYLVDLGKI